MSTERTVELRGKVPIRRRFTVAGMFALAAVLGSFPALAAEPEWPEGPYKYITLDQSVPDALVEFGRNIGVPVKVSEQVKGRMGPGLPRGTARQFLDALSQRYGLVWHYDGSTMNVSTEAETRTEVFKMNKDSIDGVTERLDRLGITDPRFPVRVSQEDRLGSVSGPPTYVDQVKTTLGVIAGPSANEPRTAAQVRVFRGRKAESQEVRASRSE